MKTLLITIAPSIIIFLYFFLSDKFKEPKGLVILIFFLGFLICLPAGILNELSNDFFYNKLSYSENLTVSFLGPAWAEELLKFAILYFIVLNRNEFNERMDGLVYGVIVSLGFATYENYTYVYELSRNLAIKENLNFLEISNYIAIVRSYSAVPMHGLNGAVMGYFFGMYAFTAEKKYLYLSLILPYLFHGFYNYLGWPDMMVIVLILLFISLYLHSKLKKIQAVKNKEFETKKI